MSSRKLSLKLFIDQKANKILFAEAGKEAIDFLLSILTLPVATIVSLISNQGMAGCLENLYRSVQSFDGYLHDNQHKNVLLKPKIHTLTQKSSLFNLTNVRKESKMLFKCSNVKCNTYVTEKKGYACWDCGMSMTTSTSLHFSGPREKAFDKWDTAGGGFVKGMLYMVMDDLVVKPISTTSTIALFAKFNVKDVEAIVEKVVYLDADMGLKLLKMVFQSKNVLSSIFLPQENPTDVPGVVDAPDA